MSKPKAKFKKVMKEYKEGKLHSGSKKGPKVKNPKQAVAIAFSEERRKASKDESKPKAKKAKKSGKIMRDYLRGAEELHEYMENKMHGKEAMKKMRHERSESPAQERMEHKRMKKHEMSERRKGVKKKVDDRDLLNNRVKPKDEPFYEFAKQDSMKAYRDEGLTPYTGADNDVESLLFSRKAGLKTRKK